jgi:Protein of unknown function (DUF1569)
MSHTTLADPQTIEALVARLEKLHDRRPRAWGKMTPHEALCHLTDSFRVALGERQASSAETWWNRTVIKYFALHTNLPWPKGVPTRPEVDQKVGGTRPVDFACDRDDVVALMRRMTAPDATYSPHPIFGPLTREEWLIWGYRHVDHHLRQFAV